MAEEGWTEYMPMDYMERRELLRQLEAYERQGIPLYLDDLRCDPLEIVETLCVHEEADYMPDYVEGPEGRLAQIRFNQVKQR